MRFLVLVLMLFPRPAMAQAQWWSFDDRRYYEPLIAGVPDATIPLNPFNRSILVYFATRSEATTPKTKVKHAYEFFRNTQPIP